MTTRRPGRPASLLLTVAAFSVVYLVWGSTYLAIRIGVRALSPSVLLGLRFFIAGLINLAVWSLFDRSRRATYAEIRTAAIAGTIMLVGGTGIVGYAERVVNSSTAALLVAVAPLWFALGDYVLGKKTLRAGQIAGIVTGFGGVWLLVWPSVRHGGGAGGSGLWTLALLLATIAWVSAGLYTRYRQMPKSIFLSAGVEMVAAGALLLLLGALLGDYSLASVAHLSLRVWGIIAYLALFGSCLAFTAYAWLLEHQPTHRVASYAYVNPVVAVLLGVLLDGDVFTRSIFFALTFITLGVTLTMTNSGARQEVSPASEKQYAPTDRLGRGGNAETAG